MGELRHGDLGGVPLLERHRDDEAVAVPSLVLKGLHLLLRVGV